MYLFGSRADGSARSDSDWDLAILTPRSIAPVALWQMSNNLAIDEATVAIELE
ncbi:nucleotidyltransferase domain-containing protein [Ectothiorhodospiraceae bacterium BW-2]|nr:nucleotidyltransferase domain-containing protein [Ectothiorhodospiraceae bacterium BW-2]